MTVLLVKAKKLLLSACSILSLIEEKMVDVEGAILGAINLAPHFGQCN